jgi:hypothetical protein
MVNADFYLGIVIILVFLWRFARTRQLYLTTMRVQAAGSEPVHFRPDDVRGFVNQAFLGRRSMKPISFWIRAFVFVIVAVCFLPFKNYEPVLYWMAVTLIALYVPWCIGHGILLKKRFGERTTQQH